LEDQAKSDSEAKRQAKEKAEQLQRDLNRAQILVRKLEQQTVQLTSKVRYFRTKVVQSGKRVNKAL
jgi:predicted  nucleic acid-binding Zn-ribbon protein